MNGNQTDGRWPIPSQRLHFFSRRFSINKTLPNLVFDIMLFHFISLEENRIYIIQIGTHTHTHTGINSVLSKSMTSWQRCACPSYPICVLYSVSCHYSHANRLDVYSHSNNMKLTRIPYAHTHIHTITHAHIAFSLWVRIGMAYVAACVYVFI